MPKRLICLFSLVVFVCLLCSGCRTTKVRTSSERVYSRYVRRSNADTVIVFVHGIFGDANSTWTNSDTRAYWPELITTDSTFDSADVYVYAYRSPYLASASTIDELVEQMRINLVADEIFTKHKRIVFLCHSMGGLVTRKLLTRYQPLAAQVPLIYFFSTPTAGSDVTRLAGAFSANPQLGDMSPSDADRYVDVLQRDWRAAKFRIVSRCAYEEKNTNGVKIVNPSSASMLCDSSVLPIEKDHIEIVKPANAQDLSYVAFKEAFVDLGKETTAADSPTEPGNAGGMEKTVVALTTRPIAVKCGRVVDTRLAVPLPAPLRPGERLADSVVSIQQGTNLKRYQIELTGRSESSIDVRYTLVGLDPSGGVCTTDGAGTIVAAFVLTQPATTPLQWPQ